MGVQPRVDAVLTGRFPANSSVAPDDFTAVDLDPGPFFAARLQFYWRERDSGRARLGHGHFLPGFCFFSFGECFKCLFHVLAARILCAYGRR